MRMSLAIVNHKGNAHHEPKYMYINKVKEGKGREETLFSLSLSQKEFCNIMNILPPRKTIVAGMFYTQCNCVLAVDSLMVCFIIFLHTFSCGELLVRVISDEIIGISSR
jgi:hypothetical protein